jgi:stage II sporulation protein R
MKKEKICLMIALVMALIITGTLVRERHFLVEARAKVSQEELAGEVLRFHVLANSDGEEDQQLKLKVKENVLLYMKKHLPEDADLSETRNWVRENLKQLEGEAEKTLLEENSSDTVNAKLENVMFPKKTYGDVTFPAGEYEALQIEIGEAKGQNWWCCLYPNLCFIDAVHAVVPEEGKQELENVLDEDSYEMVTANTHFKIKWFFFGK